MWWTQTMMRYLRSKILFRLLATYLVPLGLIIITFAAYLYYVERRNLEEELGKRLGAVAAWTASALERGVPEMLRPGDEALRLHQDIRHQLLEVKESNQIRRVFVFDPQNRSLADSMDGVSIGTPYFRLEADRTEIERAEEERSAVAAHLFTEGGVTYKSAYAPIRRGNRTVAFVGVQASADFFETLQRTRTNLARMGLLSLIAIVILSVIFSRSIVGPLRDLVKASERIGQGHLETPVKVTTSDEVGRLASNFEEMRRNLLERDKNMQMMLQGIAHEVRNPLGGIELFAGILRKQLRDADPKLTEHVNKIARETDNLRRLVDEFLAYSKEVSIDPKPFTLERLLDEVRTHCEKELDEHGIELVVEGDPSCEVVLDYYQLRRVMLNLVKNAIQAVESDGRVTIGAARRNGHLKLEVSDTGPGIDPEIGDEIFNPFFTTKERGSGLGLAFSRKIIESHNGTIRIERREPHGTRVLMQLPQPPQGEA